MRANATQVILETRLQVAIGAGRTLSLQLAALVLVVADATQDTLESVTAVASGPTAQMKMVTVFATAWSDSDTLLPTHGRQLRQLLVVFLVVSQCLGIQNMTWSKRANADFSVGQR